MSNDIDRQRPNPFAIYGASASPRNFVGDLLKFTKGEYFAGQDETEIPIGTRMVACMNSLMVGWVKWQNNKPVEHRVGLVVEYFQPQKRSELGDTDESEWETDDRDEPRDPWQLTNYLPLIDAEDYDVYTFTTSSKGGIGAVGELSKSYGNNERQRPDCYPVIELDVGSYKHSDPQFGRIKYPIFRVIDWIDRKRFNELLTAASGSSGSEPKLIDANEHGDISGTVPIKPAKKKEETRF